ncbi:MAG: hypothetical protein ACI8PT_000229 [Gammaproteobacteria bacterium]|jgi:hypothetical protein
MHTLRGQWPQANTAVQRLLELGQETQGPADLLVAFEALAESNRWQGEFSAENDYSAEAIQLIATLPAIEPGVSPFAHVASQTYAASTAWCMGYPERAKQRIDNFGVVGGALV